MALVILALIVFILLGDHLEDIRWDLSIRPRRPGGGLWHP